ncbi:hypothetical protein BA1DRAFT_03606 [Photorhabdus aegyptia]|uniref:Uncharacterized protein n=1 Tax=Photorhabdus aegyptia TaxID=2805098 RepID=A0A022PE01_9GAMM|nr:hypothetical protein BA1DRAFT_03606 [Photorhabdus aegyptia]
MKPYARPSVFAGILRHMHTVGTKILPDLVKKDTQRHQDAILNLSRLEHVLIGVPVNPAWGWVNLVGDRLDNHIYSAQEHADLYAVENLKT